MSAYIPSYVLTWTAMVILCILVIENDRLTKEDKMTCYLTYILIIAASLSEMTGLFLSGNTKFPVWVLRIVKASDYIFTPAICGAMVLQLGGNSIFRKLINITLIINTVFQVIASFTDWMNIVNEEHVYSSGLLYPFYIAISCTLIILVFLEFIRFGKGYRRHNIGSQLSILLFTVSGTVLQIVSGGVYRTAYLTVAIGVILLFIHKTEFFQMRTDDEIKSWQIQIMLGQIRPHFLFNCLSVIREIYATDKQEGDKAITTLASYLRHNMDSLDETAPIPFLKELEHTQHYIDLQKLRFGDEIDVEYDLETTVFKIPTLTLQPIVENAVTYGLRKQTARKGIVKVKTRAEEDHYEIIVSDNGPGFIQDKASNNKERSHVGIKNVRERLFRICKGDLIVDSVPGEGTTVTMLIPKEA